MDFIFNIGLSKAGPQYLIWSNVVSRIKSARKKEISLQMDHSRNVKSPRKSSVCVCWPEIRGLTQAPGMVNEDETIAKHGPNLPQCLGLCCGPASHGLPTLLAAFSHSGWADLQARV